MLSILDLRDHGVKLAATEHNADELYHILIKNFGHDPESANLEVRRVVEPLELIGAEEYQHLHDAASERLREGGKSDWPTLAAAMALEGDIWSEDVDFFGVGVPVWSTANVQFVEGDVS
jgi:predicted nucleic acid-binding protein